MDALYAFALAYLLGSIPFGLILTRLAGTQDLRSIGSGSIGATNVLRTGHKGLAAATVLLDAGKGVVAVLLASRLWPGTEGYAAVGAVVAHCYPAWLRFKGGKGFATAAGVCLALAWPVMLVCAVVWGAVLAISRISSLSSLSAVVVAPLVAWLLEFNEAAVVMAIIAGIVIFRHRGNIARLRAGTEAKIGARS